MQQITQDYLANKAKELLNSGICSRVFGWKRGEFDYDLTPAVFTTAEQIDRDFVYNGFCAANFSKYLVNETRRDAGKVAVFLKPQVLLKRCARRGHSGLFAAFRALARDAFCASLAIRGGAIFIHDFGMV